MENYILVGEAHKYMALDLLCELNALSLQTNELLVKCKKRAEIDRKFRHKMPELFKQLQKQDEEIWDRIWEAYLGIKKSLSFKELINSPRSDSNTLETVSRIPRDPLEIDLIDLLSIDPIEEFIELTLVIPEKMPI